MKTKQWSEDLHRKEELTRKIPNPCETTRSVFDLSHEKEYTFHANIVKRIGEIVLAKEFRKFEIDEYNQKVFKFLLYYFNHFKEAEEVFPDEGYKIHKQIMLIGGTGCGKTTLMDVFSRYLRLTENPNFFHNVSVTEMINYLKIHNHLDKFTYNELSSERRFNGNPVHLCLNDLGLKTHLHFGVDTKVMIDDFLLARYELYVNHNKMAHITTNLSVEEIKKTYDYRLTDRFKSYNIILAGGNSRRK